MNRHEWAGLREAILGRSVGQAGESVSMTATGDIKLTSFVDLDDSSIVYRTSVTSGIGSSDPAITYVDIDAGRDLLIDDPTGLANTVLLAGSYLKLNAGRDIRVDDESSLTAGTYVEMDAGQDIVLEGASTVDAGTYIDIYAGRDVVVQGSSSLTAGTDRSSCPDDRFCIDSPMAASLRTTERRT